MRRTSLPVLATFLVAAGCTAYEPTPPGVSLGLPYCSFECSPTGPLAAGSVDTLSITPDESGTVDLDAVTVVSDTPDVLAIGAYRARGDGEAARAVVTAGEPGVATVSVIDAAGDVLGEGTIEVLAADALPIVVTPFGAPGQTVRVASAAGVGPQFIVEPETEVLITTTPYAGGTPLQGVLAYDVDVGDLALTEDEDLARGQFRAVVPAGDHDVSVEAASATTSTRFRLTGAASE